METQQLRNIIEGAMLAFGQPLSIEKIQTLFVRDDLHEEEDNIPSKEHILDALETIQQECEGRGYELKKVSSGWRFQVRVDVAPWVNKLWEEKPQRYSRALLETIAIIAYRQPLTRGDIEEIRGVAVSSSIIKTLVEREWVKVIGQRDVPGRPSLYATTRQFLDYFNLENLESLPTLRELADIDSLTPELALELGESLGKLNDAEPVEIQVAKDNTDVDSDIDSDEIADKNIETDSPDDVPHEIEESMDEALEDSAEQIDLLDVTPSTENISTEKPPTKEPL